MLDIMRKKKNSIIIKIVFVVIVLSFIGTMFLVWGEGRSGMGGGSLGYAAKVDGSKITLEEYQNSYQRIRNVYQQIYGHLTPQAPTPDLVIYLQASPGKLYARVRKRAVAYERNISEQYLSRLADAYRRFFYQFSTAPLLIVNSDHLNFVDGANDFDLLLRRITEMRGPREFFSRGE